MAIGLTDGLFLGLSFLVPLVALVLAMPYYLRYLTRKGRLDDDVHKPGGAKVPSPSGPLIFACLVLGELLAFFLYGSLVPLAIVGAIAIAFAVGLADDLYVLGGRTKPLLLILAAGPLVAAQLLQPSVYTSKLYFPILGASSAHYSIYTILVVASFPIVSNAFNMMDGFNGELSGFSVLTSIAITFGVALATLTLSGYSLVHLATTLPLVAVSLGFYLFNRYPSKTFDGDSGSLVFGAIFVTLAVTSGVEVAAVVAIIPAILNSFYILSSVRGFVERRKIRGRPTFMGDEGLLHASEDAAAPITLVRMILLEGPQSEKGLVRSILILTAMACLLSAVTSLLTWGI